MVDKKTAFKTAGISAIVIGIAYYIAQMLITQNPIYLALIVALAVFIYGYYGMTAKK